MNKLAKALLLSLLFAAPVAIEAPAAQAASATATAAAPKAGTTTIAAAPKAGKKMNKKNKVRRGNRMRRTGSNMMRKG